MNRGTALRLLLDTDPGVDDAIAILMALAAPGAEVVGLTTVGGNVGRARATRNALALLQAAGRAEVPVARGAARPRLGRFRPSVDVHGPGGLSVRLPDPAAGPIGLDAADFMADRLSAEPGGITIVALGPLTNLSLLEERHPGVLGRAAGIVVMGGAVNARGNVTGRAEFNIYSDPLAAAQILESGYAVGLADLAASRQVAVTRGQAGGLSATGPVGRLALRILQGWFDRDGGRERFEFYDPLAVALALDPAVATVRRMAVRVGTAPGEGWGETLDAGSPGPVSLAEAVDAGRFFGLLSGLLGWRGGVGVMV